MAKKKKFDLIKKGADALVGNAADTKNARYLLDKYPKGKIPAKEIQKHFEKFGERSTFKFFGSRAKTPLKNVKKNEKKKLTAPVKTPTGTTYARKASPKDKT